MQNFNAAYDNQYRVDAELALPAEFSRLYNENLHKASEASGVEFTPLVEDDAQQVGVQAFLKKQLGLELNNRDQFYLNNGIDKKLIEANAQLEELKKTYPDIQTFDEVLNGVKEYRQLVEQNAVSVGARGGILGGIAQFAGGMAGSFSGRDPLNLITLFSPGGGGNTLLKRALVNGLENAAVEGLNQYSNVQPTRRALGEQAINPLISIALAGAGGAAFGAGMEAVPLGFKALKQRLFPSPVERAAEPTIREVLDAAAELSKTPEGRAAEATLTSHALLAENNPYGITREALQYAGQDLEQTWRAFEGLPSKTAVDRFNSDQAFTGTFLDTPEAQVARMRNPELFDTFTKQTTQVQDLESRILELETSINSRTMGDAITSIDGPTGSRVKAIEGDLQKPGLTVEKRTALEKELDMIVSTLGEKNIIEAETNSRIGPKRELVNARKSLKAAKRNQRKVQKEVVDVTTKIKQQEFSQPAPTNRAAIPARVTEKAQLEAAVKDAEVTPEMPGDEVMTTASNADGVVRINGADYPEGMLVVVDEAGNAKTAKQIFDDLTDDVNLVEAMKACSL